MKCKFCGKELQDGSTFCTSCGRSLNAAPPPKRPIGGGGENKRVIVLPSDGPSFGYALLCFLFPIVGLILYLVWKDFLPQRAHSCGMGALVGVIVGFVLSIILFIVALAVGVGWNISIRIPLL